PQEDRVLDGNASRRLANSNSNPGRFVRQLASRDRERFTWMAVSLAALLCVPAPVTSQQTTTIEERKCEGCSINIRQIAKLESNLDGPFEGQPSSMSRASNGKYFVTQYVDHGEVAV